MRTDKFGVPYFTVSDVVTALYHGKIDAVANMLCEDCQEIQQFNQTADSLGTDKLRVHGALDCSIDEFDQALQSEWFMPDIYKTIEVLDFCLNKCKTEEQKVRVKEEYAEFEKRNMVTLLQFLIYLVDFMREEEIVWGVGRGSSVASYVLYLIGVHKMDSIQYGLDWREFLR